MRNKTKRLPNAYPRKFYDIRQNSWGCLAFPLCLMCIFAAMYISNIWNGQRWWLQIIGLISVVFIIQFLIREQITAWREARIYPMFDRKVSTTTFRHGQAVLRNLLYLDKLAHQKGVPGFIAYGFPNPLRGETVTWHIPEQGMETINALIEAVEDQPEAVNDPERVLADLKRMQETFSRARDCNARFSFLLEEMRDGHSPMIWEQLKGYP